MDSTRSKIRNYCFRLLKYRPRAREEIIERLERKRFPPELIKEAVDELTESGLLNDREFVKYWINWRLEVNPRGKKIIGLELRNKGIDEELISEALGLIPADEELKIAGELALKRYKRLENLEPAKAKARLYAYLKRRGFRDDTIWNTIRGLNENR